MNQSMNQSKTLATKLLLLVSSLTLLLLVTVTPAYCDTEPTRVFYQYIRQLYYATKLAPMANYWVKQRRIPLNEMSGTRAAAELKVMKKGYVYQPKILVEVMDGKTCKMKGSGIALDDISGRTVPCTLDVVMYQEDGVWKIQVYTWNASFRRTTTF